MQTTMTLNGYFLYSSVYTQQGCGIPEENSIKLSVEPTRAEVGYSPFEVFKDLVGYSEFRDGLNFDIISPYNKSIAFAAAILTIVALPFAVGRLFEYDSKLLALKLYEYNYNPLSLYAKKSNSGCSGWVARGVSVIPAMLMGVAAVLGFFAGALFSPVKQYHAIKSIPKMVENCEERQTLRSCSKVFAIVSAVVSVLLYLGIIAIAVALPPLGVPLFAKCFLPSISSFFATHAAVPATAVAASGLGALSAGCGVFSIGNRSSEKRRRQYTESRAQNSDSTPSSSRADSAARENKHIEHPAGLEWKGLGKSARLS
jgi:hypothetical protein